MVVPTGAKRVVFYGMQPHSRTTLVASTQGGQQTKMSVCVHIGQAMRQNYTYDELSNVVEEWPQPTETTGKNTLLLAS